MSRIAIVGTGFSGIGLAARLLQQGRDDLVLFERSGDVGGVWRDNIYPGAACDVASHLYSFSFAPRGDWSRRFAEQPQIHAYLQRVAREFGVLPHVRFSTEVLSAAWDGRAWQLHLSDGTTHETDVLVAACGQLSRPAVPDIPGLSTFAGTMFHSARWDPDFDARDRRVAVLGTGASAIQFVPEIAARTAALTIFQRSAPYVIPKPDRLYGAATTALLERFPAVLAADRLRTFVSNELRSLGFNTEPRLMKAFALRFERGLHDQVPDPALRALVTPDYPIGCKRILQSNDWYPALCLPQVSVTTSRILQMTPQGPRTADGMLHEVDTVILGTGFAATDLLAPMQVTGRDGRTLQQAWTDGAEAHLGTTVAGFPNLFLLYGPNTNLGHNSIVLMLEAQFALILDALRHLPDRGTFEVTEQAQAASNAWLQRRLARTVFATGCRSWYLTAQGRNTQNWPGTTLDFRRRTRRVRLADYRITPAASRQPVG